MEQINPYIHVIKVEHDWWPPLLWPDKQLRSVFPEPSHMGNYAAILLPVLWFYLLNDSRDKRFKFVLGTGYSLFIFMIFDSGTYCICYVFRYNNAYGGRITYA